MFTRGDPELIGNPLLKPEIADTFELGVLYRGRQLWIFDRLDSALSGFLVGTQDGIVVGDPVALTGPGRLRNSTSLWTAGAELELRLNTLDWVEYEGTVAFHSVVGGGSGKDLLNLPAYLTHHWLFVFPWRTTFVGFGLSVTGPQPREDGDNPLGTGGEPLFFDRQNPMMLTDNSEVELGQPVDLGASDAGGRVISDHGDIIVHQGIAYVTDAAQSLLTVDVADPMAPQVIHEVDGFTLANDLILESENQHLVVSNGFHGVILVSLADPRAPRVLNRTLAGQTRSVHGEWPYVYSASSGAVAILKIFDPTEL